MRSLIQRRLRVRRIRYLGAASPNILDLITQEAQSQGVPPNLAVAVATQESGINQGAVGSKGEIGVFQLMPSSFPGQNISDLNTNVSLGVGYLSQLFNEFGDWGTALAAYNFGPGNVAAGKPIPSSTQSYVSNIFSNSGVSTDTSTIADTADSSDTVLTDSSGDVADLGGNFDPSFVAPAILGLLGIGLLAYVAST